MILVDTSVWVDHLRKGAPVLAAALEQGRVLMHPFVLGELACGKLKNRGEVLRLLGELPAAPMATDAEALDFIERRALMGRDIGYIDVHLLASVILAGSARLWTRDQRLAVVAQDLELAYVEQTRARGFLIAGIQPCRRALVGRNLPDYGKSTHHLFA